MKETVLNRLAAVINALDNVSVHGKMNLANLSGSIAILEDILKSLADCDITEAHKENAKTE